MKTQDTLKYRPKKETPCHERKHVLGFKGVPTSGLRRVFFKHYQHAGLKPTDSLGCWFLSNPECPASSCQDARCIGFLQLGVGLLLREHRHLRSNPEQLKRCVQTRHPPVKLCLSKLTMGKSECCQLEYLRVSQCHITNRHHLYTPSRPCVGRPMVSLEREYLASRPCSGAWRDHQSVIFPTL